MTFFFGKTLPAETPICAGCESRESARFGQEISGDNPFASNTKNASRLGSGKACRNSFADLVMLPGLELLPVFLPRARNGRETNDVWLSQTADRPCPNRADTLEPMRKFA
ncbi:MAG: hypothetical protein EOM37_20610 [Proteobacteria bacterium]|nr:hypothetical protein [Pseudomonadota bacterium]